MIKFLSNKWFHTFCLALLFFLATAFSFSNFSTRKNLNNYVFDWYNNIKPRESSEQVLIIDIDEKSLMRLGQWPWSRDIVAELVSNLKELGARVVAFDMVFAESDRTSPKQILNTLSLDNKPSDIQDFLNSLPDNDETLSSTIKNSGNVVTGFTRAKAEETRRMPFQTTKPTILVPAKNNFSSSVSAPEGVATNLPVFSSQAAGNGHFMMYPESDGIVRSINLFYKFPKEQRGGQKPLLYPFLGLEALRVFVDPEARYLVKSKSDVKLIDTKYQIQLSNYIVPVDDGLKFRVYYRDIREDEYLSAYKVIDIENYQKIKELVNNKIVFVGTSAEGLKDIRSIPLKRKIYKKNKDLSISSSVSGHQQSVPGVEVHVNALEQILQNKYLVRPQTLVAMEGIILLITGLIIIIVGFYINALWKGLLTLGVILGMFITSWLSYINLGLLLDPVYPSLVLFLLFISSSLLSYFRSEIDRKQVKTAFGHYISPVFMEELTKNPDKLKLGGEVRELTVMFTDIRSFTKISESLSPEELIQLMNDFLTPMSNLVMESRGTIDKYMGDAMMAFWNAPLDDPDHARQACLAALKMNEALEPINKRLEKKASADGSEPLKLSAGIGVNTGKCSVGNMGSKQRFAYSALGDSVNLAARLEGQTKTYGVDNLIGEDTYGHIKDFAVIELDIIQVVGREEPVKIYTLIGDEEYAQNTEFKKWQAAHNAMLAAYRIADFTCAAQDCKEAAELADGKLKEYYKLYNKRIIKYTKTPPSDDWNGVYVAKSK